MIALTGLIGALATMSAVLIISMWLPDMETNRTSPEDISADPSMSATPANSLDIPQAEGKSRHMAARPAAVTDARSTPEWRER